MMWETTKLYLSIMLPEKEDQEKWLKGYNLAMGMTPNELIEKGFEHQVMTYLRFYALGPY